jgi:hypothetical protein
MFNVSCLESATDQDCNCFVRRDHERRKEINLWTLRLKIIAVSNFGFQKTELLPFRDQTRITVRFPVQLL